MRRPLPNRRVLAALNLLTSVRGTEMLYKDYVLDPLAKDAQVACDRHEVHFRPIGDALTPKKRGEVDAIVVIGGDGTLSSVAHEVLARPAWRDVPIAVLPAGFRNGLAASLGVLEPRATVRALLKGEPRATPTFRVAADGELVAHMLGALHFGTFADALVTAHRLLALSQESAFIAEPPQRQLLGILRHALLHPRRMPCALEYEDAATGRTVAVEGPLRLVALSHAPWEHYGYTLAPGAALDGRLHVTYATAAATRGRMFHLLRHEACEQRILAEDGVATAVARRATVTFRWGPATPPSLLAALRGDALDTLDADGGRVEMATLDGELCPFSPRAGASSVRVTVEPGPSVQLLRP